MKTHLIFIVPDVSICTSFVTTEDMESTDELCPISFILYFPCFPWLTSSWIDEEISS